MDEKELKQAYKELLDELNDTEVMFPNGRDYDAEDWDKL